MGTTDSKLAFRKGVFKLFEERSIPKDFDDYWTLFWILPETIDDVYTLISTSDIRKTRNDAIENLETLIDRIMEHMDYLLNASSIENTHLLNCCRILTRIIPFIFESADHIEWENQFFWTPQVDKPCRGETLVMLTLKSLFLAGFTLPSTIGSLDSRVNYVIWETGVGCSTPIGSSRDNDTNRAEVLRLLTVLLSKSMYTTPSHIVSRKDPWLDFITAKIEKKLVLAFLCSMINISCKYNPLSWTVVPYNHIMFNDPRESLVAHCLRILLIVLDHGPAKAEKTVRVGPEDPTHHTDSADNIFRHYFSKLHRGQDFQFLIDGIYRILSSPMQSLSSYIPGPSKRVRYHVEMMMLCWKLLETNKRFSKYLMETERGLDLMVVLMFYANENKLDPSQVGLVRMCAFMLQTLSSDKLFSLKINQPFEGHACLPASSRIPNFQGSYANYLILGIFSLIASSRGTLSTLYPAFITTITNISFCIKNITPITASKLIALFSSMSAPAFLLADEANHELIEYLLEAFNNIIYYQFSDNPYFVCAILRNSQKFKRLANFNLDNALIEKSKQIKELRRQKSAEEQKTRDAAREGEQEVEQLEAISRQSSSSSNPIPSNQVSLEHLSGAKNGFNPTHEWAESWHSCLSLDTITILIDHLKPELEKKELTGERAAQYIRNLSVDRIKLPTVLQPVQTRNFQWTESLLIWFQSMLWGHTYISSISNYGSWNNTQIKLFHIELQHQEPYPTTSNPVPTHASRPTLTTSKTV
ncbi:high-temperature-induced dauer-formation protein-domain-containing protein, partial [Sporodiniella umbellata]